MKTYNTVVTSKEVKTLENVVTRSPYECINLGEGRFGFMDNERGDIRNYFADTLGYECTNYEAFGFEFFDEPQSVEPSKPSSYTPNGWEGSKYDIKKGAKEVAKELRAYIKTNPDLNACKWSIRSNWGMIADSLYISLMSAPFDPFSEEYKIKHEYRYNRGYSEHGDIEDYTTPEAYKLIKKVKAFVMQYIHDDSDGMIDYFDRNIYDHYEIGQYDKPFQLIEKKESPKHGELSSEASEEKVSDTVVTPESLEIVAYSEKAIAVFGNTKAIKDELKKLGGKFNPALKHNGEKRAGWIFSKKQADKVRALLAPSVEAAENITLPEPPKELDITDVLDEPEAKQESDRIAFAKASKAFIQEWRANNPYPGSDHLEEFNTKFNRDYSAFADKYGVSSYLVPSLCPTERGEYKETALDRQKKAADILVESIEGNWYTIRLNRQIELKSKRIKRYDNGCIAVPESVYNKLQSKYNVMCNF